MNFQWFGNSCVQVTKRNNNKKKKMNNTNKRFALSDGTERSCLDNMI